MTLGLDPDELVACVACGLCLPHCPTYRVTGLELASPRGRIAAMRAVDGGMAAADATFVRAMRECVQCRGCEAACPSGVPFGHLMETTRDAMRHVPSARPAWRVRVAEWLGYRVVLPRHWLLLVLSWVLWLAQRLGVAGRLAPAGVSPPSLSARSLAVRLLPDATPDVVLFTGCVMDAWQRDVHRDAMTVMRATGARVGLIGSGGACCGALHAHAGRLDEARSLAQRVISATDGDVEVVVDSAGCGAALKSYGELLDTDEAREFSARVSDFSEWVVARAALPVQRSGRRVVVADPCHLRHVQHADGAVRTLLAPAYDLAETADDGLCCGAGGVYAAREPGLAGAIRDRKAAAIRAAAGESANPDAPVLVVSANPGCALHLGAVPGLIVRHPAELLAEALP
ncbi:MAG TPA: heterodisulfide reductase-related iron-sulfur binding cluster [Acidimicrobiia bacterium]|nr:heterodisulfide reductase-related iron-sulfur binding cluster [Acidimicrobiia bacterium]